LGSKTGATYGKGMKILGTLIESTFQEKEAQMLQEI
jgi:hypothetical protein